MRKSHFLEIFPFCWQAASAALASPKTAPNAM